MDCFSCKTLLCCPEHCCDWDTCRCKDCESCGGEGSERPAKPEEPEKTESPKVSSPQPVKSKSSALQETSFDDYINQKVQEKLKEMRDAEAKEQEVYEAKKRAEKARHDEILAASRETLAKNKMILESTQGTIEKLQNTIQGIKDTEKKFQEFQDAFGRVMTTALEKCLGPSENPEEMKEKFGTPRQSSIEEIGQVLSTSPSVVFLLGAGVSSESGVFTFKDSEDTWEVEGTQMDLPDVLDLQVLQSSPLEFWQAVQFCRMRIVSCSPNPVHFALDELLKVFRANNRKLSIISVNFDGLERQVFGSDPDFYEINGNIHEMRCLFECGEMVFPSVDLDDMIYTIPLCPACSAIARPNFFLNGDSFGECFYRAETAASIIEGAQVLVVVGTQLRREFLADFVRSFVQQGKTVVEINVEPVIQYGNVMVMPARCTDVVPLIVEVVKSCIG
jgi:NAD-dependent deacetylase